MAHGRCTTAALHSIKCCLVIILMFTGGSRAAPAEGATATVKYDEQDDKLEDVLDINKWGQCPVPDICRDKVRRYYDDGATDITTTPSPFTL